MTALTLLRAPLRDPDHVSKRGVNYWWAPEWIRCLDSMNNRFGKIRPVKVYGEVQLHAVSKDGNETFIRGSIQQEFRDWHEQRKIDYFFLADANDPNSLDDIILAGEV